MDGNPEEIREALGRAAQAAGEIGYTLAKVGAALDGFVRQLSALRPALAEAVERKATEGDPFARRALADAGHPYWCEVRRLRMLWESGPPRSSR